jgi:hypothetical protein
MNPTTTTTENGTSSTARPSDRMSYSLKNPETNNDVQSVSTGSGGEGIQGRLQFVYRQTFSTINFRESHQIHLLIPFR